MKSNISDAKLKELLDQADADGIQKVVVGAVVAEEGKVLFLERKPDDFLGGLVELPSGTVDEGEELLPALAREVKEETGLDVESVDEFINTFDYTSGSGKTPASSTSQCPPVALCTSTARSMSVIGGWSQTAMSIIS